MPTPLLGRCVRRCICQPLPAVRAPLRRGPVRSRPLSTTASTASPPVHAAQRRCPAGRAALLLASPRDGGRPATAAAAALSTTARRAFVFPSSSSSSSPSGAEDAAFPSATERDVLAAALLRVPELGFTAAALAAGAADAGYPPGSAAAAAVGGGVGSGVVGDDSAFALVRWHLVASRRALGRRAEEVFGEAAERGEKLGMGRKIEALVWERLMMNRPLIARWQEALALMALPSNVPTAVGELALLSDELWHLAGDASMDASWYTKRGGLAAVYAATELFMTTDLPAAAGGASSGGHGGAASDGKAESAEAAADDDAGARQAEHGFAETRRFLRRRLDEVQSVGGAARDVAQWLAYTAGAGVNVLRSKGLRI